MFNTLQFRSSVTISYFSTEFLFQIVASTAEAASLQLALGASSHPIECAPRLPLAARELDRKIFTIDWKSIGNRLLQPAAAIASQFA